MVVDSSRTAWWNFVRTLDQDLGRPLVAPSVVIVVSFDVNVAQGLLPSALAKQAQEHQRTSTTIIPAEDNVIKIVASVFCGDSRTLILSAGNTNHRFTSWRSKLAWTCNGARLTAQQAGDWYSLLVHTPRTGKQSIPKM